jgi:hypothetical protein
MSFQNASIQLKEYLTDIFFETGTYHGKTTRIAEELGFSRVITVELQEYLYKIAKEKNKDCTKIEYFLGDSPKVMKEILPETEGQITFWLDAHIDGGNITSTTPKIRECPLYEELDVISTLKRKDHIILIDDLRIIGNYGWGSSTVLNVLKEKILDINENYTFSTIEGIQKDDILVAKIL